MRQKIREDTGRCVPAEGLIQHPPRALPTICCEHEIESRRPLRFRGIMKGGLALGFNVRLRYENAPLIRLDNAAQRVPAGPYGTARGEPV